MGELKDLVGELPGLQLVDVREWEEHEAGNIGGINLPFSNFDTSYLKLDISRPVVVYCASGRRSRKAALILMEGGFGPVFSLKGGINGTT